MKITRACFWVASLLMLSPLAAIAAPTQTGGGGGLSESENKILGALAQGNISEVEAGKYVQKKASSPAVQSFAKRMVDDHSKLDTDLKKWASDNSIQIPAAQKPDEGKALMKSLSKYSGKTFDSHYMEAMLKDHRKDIAEVQKFIAENPQSALKPILVQTLPILENHIRIAENTAGQLGLSASEGLNQPEHPIA